jgi:hypothetical protein
MLREASSSSSASASSLSTPETTGKNILHSQQQDHYLTENASVDANTDLEAICERLGNNDPTLTTVSLPYSALCQVTVKVKACRCCSTQPCPCHYPEEKDGNGMALLCRALQQSTHIYTLELNNARRPCAAAAICLANTLKYHTTLHTLKLTNCQSNGLLPILLFQALQRQKQRQRPRNKKHQRPAGPRPRRQQQRAQADNATPLPKAAHDSHAPNNEDSVSSENHGNGTSTNRSNISSTSTSATTSRPDQGPDQDDVHRERHCGLRVLELSGDSIFIAAAGALQSMLATNTHLTTLRLVDMELDDSVQRAIVRGLQAQPTQQTSSSSSSSLSTGLQVLSLVNCGITDSFCVGLAAVLNSSPGSATNTKRKSGLTELDLTRNRITDEGAVALAQVLANNNGNSLVQLSLAWNRWTMTKGLQAFVDRLPQYTRLRALNMYHPDMCPSLNMFQQVVDGMVDQANGIHNCTLTSLSIGCETIGGVVSSDTDGVSSDLSSSSSSLTSCQQERSAVLDELRFVWQEPAYSEAAKRLSFLLHLNQSGRRYLEGVPLTDTDTGSDRDRDHLIPGVDDAQPWRAVWPEILHKFGTHPDPEYGASGIFHLLQTRPGNLF